MRGRTSSHRRDGNHHALVAVAEGLGAYVLDTSQLGGGAPDVMCHTQRLGWFAVEIKAGRGKLRVKQQALQRRVPVSVWRTPDDVIATLTGRKEGTF